MYFKLKITLKTNYIISLHNFLTSYLRTLTYSNRNFKAMGLGMGLGWDWDSSWLGLVGIGIEKLAISQL